MSRYSNWLPSGGGEMGERIRAMDWARHPLGGPDRWPEALRTSIGICLNSAFPTAIYWGPELWLFYNDAWSVVPRDRHPWALGKQGAEVWTDIWEVVGPQFREVLEERRGVSTYDQLLPIVREGRPEETYWNYALSPIIGADGEVAGVFNQGRETTREVMANRARQAETDRLRDLFSQAPGAIAVLQGPRHQYEIANAAYRKLVGRAAGLIGNTVAEALPEVVEQGFHDILDEVYRSGEPYVGKAVPVDLVRNRRRETRIVDFVFQPTRSLAGPVDGIFIEAWDVTEHHELLGELQELNLTLEQRVRAEVAERLETEEKLHQSQKMEAVGQLTGGVAHDFNNMLAVIMGGLILVRRKLDKGDTDVDEHIQSAIDSAKSAGKLTRRLLGFARQQPLDPSLIDAGDLVLSMRELLARTLGDPIDVETIVGRGLWPVWADAVQLESTILNLAVNARDAMPDGGTLTIETANRTVSGEGGEVPPGDYVAITVADTGTGMEEEVLQRAFEPFFTTKGRGKGTGLGLAQVFGFARQSGGAVVLSSEPGMGTAVTVFLPRREGSLEKTGPERPAALPMAREGETILLVEDEDRVRKVSAAALEELGYEVLSAPGGSDALRMIEEGLRPNLLFTDITMPRMSGRELAKAARQLIPDVRVLFVTGYVSDGEEAELSGETEFCLRKPFTLEQLATKVRTVLDG